MSLLLHIGLPKTGTTFLQKTFHKAFPESSKAPVLYPNVNFYNHQIALYEPLGKYLPWVPNPGNPANWQKLRTILVQPNDFPTLLSAEALSALNVDGLRELSVIISGWSIGKVLITARPLTSLLPSHWQQNMKQGGRGKLEIYSEKIMKAIEMDQSPAHVFCFANTIRLWRSVFGSLPVTVLIMDGSHHQNLYSFAAQCDIGSEYHELFEKSIPPASQQNLSFSIEECRKLLVINRKIFKGLIQPKARKKAIDLFFKRRDSGALYEKPSLPLELKERADLIDKNAFAEVAKDSYTKLVYGKDFNTSSSI
jgi:hypothetical protein